MRTSELRNLEQSRKEILSGIPKWVVTFLGSGLFTMFMVTGGWAFTSVQADVAELKRDMPNLRERVSTTEEGVRNVVDRLDRIEDKLDIILELYGYPQQRR